MSQNQLVKMILTEGGLIGLTGALLGGGAGIGLSLILIQVINKQTFGWTIHFSLFHPFLFVVFGLVLLTAVIASLLPAKKAINIHIAQAVHYE
jgi:putative ABC transport system permease protein